MTSLTVKPKASGFKTAGVGLLAAASVLAVSSFSPAEASGGGGGGGSTSPITQVQSMVTDVGAIGAAALTVVLGVMGARIAIKLVNRVAVKG